MCLVVIGVKISSKTEMVFRFRCHDSFFLQSNVYRHRQTENCRFLVLKRNIENVAAGFALFTIVETSRFIG